MLCLITFGITYFIFGTTYILKDYLNVYIRFVLIYTAPGWLMSFSFIFFIPIIFRFFNIDVEGDIFKKSNQTDSNSSSILLEMQ